MDCRPLDWPLALGACCVVLAAISGIEAAEPGRVVFDFESGDLQGWEVVEGKFPKLVCNREFFFHQKVNYNKQGSYYLSTLELPKSDRPSDTATGVLESPVFVLSGSPASFLIGGGSHATTYVALCTGDGQEVRRASGKNSQTMQRITWDTGKLVGKEVFLRLVDKHTAGWGHVTFDDFNAPGRLDPEATRRRNALRRQQRLDRARQELVKALSEAGDSLRLAVEDRTVAGGEGYPEGRE